MRSRRLPYLAPTAFAAALFLLGCRPKPTPSPAVRPSAKAQAQAQGTPPRPTVPPAPFKVFHHEETSITLVTPENASDQQIESLVWQLRDAAHARTFDTLKISQKLVDGRDPIVWFHIYRGARCASEKYAPGEPPCGASYHAAADYTFGGYANREADSGILLHDENHQTQLWDPDAPYTASPAR